MTTQPWAFQKFHVVTLSILLGLFCFRVLAQLLQRYLALPFLPPFAAWQSGAVPYETLLATQLLIVFIYAWILLRIVTNRMQPSRRHAWLFSMVGYTYFIIMTMRLAIGFTGLSEHYWFQSYLPILFHFVLSSYLIVVGHFHIQATARQR